MRMREAIVLVVFAICSKAATASAWWRSETEEAAGYCLSWRMAVEANNIRAWRTVPAECSGHVEAYMMGGQYERDLSVIVDSICSYIDSITLSGDGLDAWILDVDDTCISNLLYYRGRRYGCDPFDPVGFKAWALSGRCSAIPDVLRVFVKLIATGFKVFLVTGRDEETLGQATIRNLHNQGFFAYHRLILRGKARYYTSLQLGSSWQKKGTEYGGMWEISGVIFKESIQAIAPSSFLIPCTLSLD
ncbi:acid phosphatase 1 isoform X5 [Salvia miltiorrhiza]|uniref:acid phosphatase 1 isoform X5 n=1 Tax=Salvia miltiorrhiza TaxID=226208 RepID=UPI0025AC4843|nr:acid phosphatase 1 isoform X5 [Salvia miltiorrhiza]